MSAADAQPESLSAVTEALESWRQGDCFVGKSWFAFRLELLLPVTPAAKVAAADELTLAETREEGFVVLTQTCDVVRDCAQRPFIEVAPLVAVAEQQLLEIQRGYRPQYAYIPGVAALHLVADLDRVMTLEKGVVARWERTPGCQKDEEARAFAYAVSRKRARIAFPDDFVEVASLLSSRIKKKHDKRSPEGEALRALHEIRVRAAPSWEADTVELMFYFIRDIDVVMFEGHVWSERLQEWLKLIEPTGRYTEVDGLVITYEDLTAKDYLESDRLDLDHLSRRDDDDTA